MADKTERVCVVRYLTSNSCLAFGDDRMQLYEFLPLRYMGNTEVYCGQKCQSRIGCMTIRKKTRKWKCSEPSTGTGCHMTTLGRVRHQVQKSKSKICEKGDCRMSMDVCHCRRLDASCARYPGILFSWKISNSPEIRCESATFHDTARHH